MLTCCAFSVDMVFSAHSTLVISDDATLGGVAILKPQLKSQVGVKTLPLYIDHSVQVPLGSKLKDEVRKENAILKRINIISSHDFIINKHLRIVF